MKDSIEIPIAAIEEEKTDEESKAKVLEIFKSDESGLFAPFARLYRKQNAPNILQRLGEACEYAMANRIDLQGIDSELIVAIGTVHRLAYQERNRLAGLMSKENAKKGT